VTTITVAAGAARETFSIGDSGPLTSTLYVFRESDQKVLLTDLAPKDFVNKTLMTFRRKDLLRLSQGDVDRIRLTYPTTEIVLYQGQENQKANGSSATRLKAKPIKRRYGLFYSGSKT
jgi:hypothetical protein